MYNAYSESEGKSIAKPDDFIKKPNSYQKRLFCLFQQGEINKLEYLSELARYTDFRIKQTILNDSAYENLISDIEFKELINYLGEAY